MFSYFRHESRLIREGGIIRSLAGSFIFGGVMPIMMGLTFTVFVVSGGELTSQRVFTTLSIVNPLRLTSITFVVNSFFLLYETRVALKRIQVNIYHEWNYHGKTSNVE